MLLKIGTRRTYMYNAYKANLAALGGGGGGFENKALPPYFHFTFFKFIPNRQNFNYCSSYMYTPVQRSFSENKSLQGEGFYSQTNLTGLSPRPRRGKLLEKDT